MSTEITFLGLALAIDAAVVSFALGLLSLKNSLPRKIFRGILITSVFSAFQFGMLWLGSYGGYLLAFSTYGYLSQIITAMIFLLIGLKFYKEGGSSEENKTLQHGILPLILLGIATSIDALAAGIGLGTIPRPELAAMEVGGITFLMCGVFYGMSQFLSRIPEKWLLYFGGGVFVVLAMRTLLPYLLKGIL